MNLNNIDDIFEKGLAEYSEQPSKGLWNKISGKMLRYELFRLNFTNVPKLWIGAAAAGMLAVSLFIINPFAVEPVEELPATAIQKDAPTKESNPPEESIFIPDEDIAQADKSAIPGSPSLTTINEVQDQTLDESIVIDEPETIGASDSQTEIDARIATGDTKNTPVPAAAELAIANKNEVTDVAVQPEETSTPNYTKASEALPGGAVVAIAPETAKNSDAENPSGIKTISGDTPESLTRDANEREISQLNSREVKLSTDGPDYQLNERLSSEAPTLVIANLDRTGQESGKIQKMSSKSYQLVQFFKGKYKPPKRKFDEKSASLYKTNKPFFSMAAYFSPEMTEYARMASTSREISYAGGLALSYNKAKFLVEAGLEYSYTNDLGDYMVDMETYDSIGYYNEVGGFVPDPDNPGSVIFETSTVEVYDSVQHNLHQQTQNHYAYLQFPVMIGYQAVERGLFSAYIKAGPSFSFLLNKQEQGLNFYDPDATVNQIENYTPNRMNTSIQVLVSVRFKFQLNENLGILAEPTYRYYLKSVYDTSNDQLKNPYGIGVRCGLYFDL
jgi:hypothetical protein